MPDPNPPQKDLRFIYTVFWGDAANPTNSKSWYLKDHNECTASVAGVKIPDSLIGKLGGTLTRYFE